MESPVIHVLFICSLNKWRSPTAEKIYRNDPRIEVRSAGTSRKARRTVSTRDLNWADTILAMESKHKQRLLADYPQVMREREVHVLEIEDNYRFMDPTLIEDLKAAIDPILDADTSRK